MNNETATDLQNEIRILKDENERLKWLIKKFQHRLYGSTSEKHVEDEIEQMLFNELEVEAQSIEPEQVELIDGYERKPKGRGKRKPFPEDLPREEVIIDLPDVEKVCPHDGTTLKEIGEEVTEKLKVVPAQMIIVIEKKKKYACPCCASHMDQAKANSVLPGTIATPKLLSFIVFSKFFQGLPFYRIEELFKLQGIDLSRALMASWMIRLTEKLRPLWNILEDLAESSGYMAIDATGVQVLKEKGRAPQTKSTMWVRGSPELGIALFDYDPSGGGAVAKRLVSGFVGALQADAHKGYGVLDEKNIFKLGCMMHARRRFHEAWLSGQKKPGLSEMGLKMIKRLYRYEAAYKAQGLSHGERYQARLKEVKPYLEKIKKWAEEKQPKVLKSSPIGNAIYYFLNEYEELTAFLKDGRYEIDNGWVERVIRKFAIGRNNWMFSDTVAGAESSALLYSLVITAKLNEKDPFEVLAEILRLLPSADTIEDYERLASLLVKKTVV